MLLIVDCTRAFACTCFKSTDEYMLPYIHCDAEYTLLTSRKYTRRRGGDPHSLSLHAAAAKFKQLSGMLRRPDVYTWGAKSSGNL